MTRFSELVGFDTKNADGSDYTPSVYSNGQAPVQLNKTMRNNLVQGGYSSDDADEILWSTAVNEAQNRKRYDNDAQLFDAADEIYKLMGGQKSSRDIRGANALTDFADFLGGVGDTVYGGIGNVLDFGFDNTVGNLVGLFNRDAGQAVKNAFTGNDLKWIPSILGDVALVAGTGGTALPFVLPAVLGGLGFKAAIDNRDNIRQAITGKDVKSGADLSADQRSASGFAAALDTLLSMIPGAGAVKGAEKVAGRALATRAAGGDLLERNLARASENVTKARGSLDDAISTSQATPMQLFPPGTAVSAGPAQQSKIIQDALDSIPDLEKGLKSATSKQSRAFDKLNAFDTNQAALAGSSTELLGRGFSNEALEAAGRTNSLVDRALGRISERVPAMGELRARENLLDLLSRDARGNLTGVGKKLSSGEYASTDNDIIRSLVSTITGRSEKDLAKNAERAGRESAEKAGVKAGKKGEDLTKYIEENATPQLQGLMNRLADFGYNGFANSGKIAQGASYAGLGLADLQAQLAANDMDLGTYLTDVMNEGDFGSALALASMLAASAKRPGAARSYRYYGNAIAPRAFVSQIGGQAGLNHEEGRMPMVMSPEELDYYNALVTGSTPTAAYTDMINNAAKR